jgi:hypothetical protein
VLDADGSVCTGWSSRLLAVRSTRVRPWPNGLREAMLRAAAPGFHVSISSIPAR